MRPKSREIKYIWRIKRPWCWMWEVVLRPQEGHHPCSSGALQMKHVLHLILGVGDATLVLKAAKTPSLTDLFLLYTLSPLGWSRSPGRYHNWEGSAFPSSAAQLILSHTSLTSPTNVAWFPTVLGRFISIFPCQLTGLPAAWCWTAALCALHTCSKLLFLDKACRQTSSIKVRALGRAQLISTHPWRTSRWKWVCRCEQLK